jgi:hypothetical protein
MSKTRLNGSAGEVSTGGEATPHTQRCDEVSIQTESLATGYNYKDLKCYGSVLHARAVRCERVVRMAVFAHKYVIG